MIYIYITLAVCGVLFNYPKIFNFLVLAFLSYLTFISPNVADNESYKFMYLNMNLQENYGTGYGWYFLNNLAKRQNLSFMDFKVILSILSILLLMLTAKYFLGKNSNIIWSCYLLYPGLIDQVQIRFFFATSISIFSLIFLYLFLYNKKNWALVSYVLLIIVAYSIHTATIFYLLFIFLKIVGKHIKKFWILLLFLSFILFLSKNLVKNILSTFSSDRQLYYLNGSEYTFSTVFLWVIIILCFFGLSYKINEFMSKSEAFSFKEKSFSQMVLGINEIMIILLPVSTISLEPIRIERISWFLMYILLSCLSSHGITINIKKIKINCKVISVFIALFGFFELIYRLAPLAFNTFNWG